MIPKFGASKPTTSRQRTTKQGASKQTASSQGSSKTGAGKQSGSGGQGANKRLQEERGYAVLWRNSWNIDVVTKALAVAVGSTAIALIAVTGFAWRTMNPPAPKYFAVKPSGRIIPIEPLNTPLLSDARVLAAVRNIIISAYSFDFSNIHRHMTHVQEHFAQGTWKQFYGSLTQNDIIQSTVQNRRTVSATPAAPPVIEAEHTLPDGRYGWKINMPIIVNYAAGNPNKQDTHYYSVTVVVVRTRPTSHPDGIEIKQFVVQQMAGAPQNH